MWPRNHDINMVCTHWRLVGNMGIYDIGIRFDRIIFPSSLQQPVSTSQVGIKMIAWGQNPSLPVHRSSSTGPVYVG